MTNDLKAFFSHYEYEICLFIGLIAILNFAHKQLKTPLPEGSSEEKIPALRGSNVLNSAGHTLFFEAYLYFGISLTLVYLTFCFSESIYSFATSANEAGSNPAPKFGADSGVWPLVVATLIVSLSADIPGIKDLELFFRKLSRYSAGIYRNIIKTRDKLQEVRFQKLPDTAYGVELKQYGEQISFAAAMTGHSSPEFEIIKSKILRNLLLHHWTLSSNSPIKWKTAARSNAEILLGEKSQETEKLNVTLVSCMERVQSSLVKGKTFRSVINVAFPSGFAYQAKDTPEAAKIWGDFSQEIEADLESARLTIDSLAKLSDDLETLFAILFNQDRFPEFDKEDEPAFEAVLQHIRSYSSQVIRNLIVRMTFYFTVFSGLISFTFVGTREYFSGGGGIENALSSAANVAWVQAIGYGAGCLVALLATVAFMRLYEEPLMNTIRTRQLFPVTYIPLLFVVCASFVLLARCAIWAVRKVSDYPEWDLFLQTFGSAFPIELIDSLAIAFVGVIFFVVMLRMDDERFGEDRKFKAIVIRHGFLLSLLSGIVVFLGHTVAIGGDRMWYPERNSSLLYLILAIVVPLATLFAMRDSMNKVAMDRHARETG